MKKDVNKIKKSTVYLDYASATPIDEKVLKLISSYEKDFFANATSLYKSGVKARNIIEQARETISKGLNAHNDEIVFTGSSTESSAMVILGVVNNFQLNKKGLIPHLITTEIEHPAVLKNFELLEKRGLAEVTYIKIDKSGIVNVKDIKDSIKSNTALVSVMYANNEIGTIQPIREIAKAIRYYKKTKKLPIPGLGTSFKPGMGSLELYPLFHTDATQAMNYLDTSNVEKLGVDMLSFNGSKIYGPKGVGVLYKKRNVKLSPIYSGGEQEFGLRSGTENMSSIAGLALAFGITNKIKDKEVKRLTQLRDYAISKLFALSKEPFLIKLNGDQKQRLPNNINISISLISSELVVLELDAKGVEVSSKSACKSDEEGESYVIDALRVAQGDLLSVGEGSIRVTLGRGTKKSDLDRFINVLSDIFEKYRKWKK